MPISNIEQDKCPNIELGATLWVCVPNKKSHTKSAEEAAHAANSSHPTGGSVLAQPVVIQPANKPVGGPPLDDSTVG